MRVRAFNPRALSRGESRRQRQLVRQIITRHMRPIVAIAQAHIEPDSDVRLPASLRMPRAGLGVTKLPPASDGMLAAARTESEQPSESRSQSPEPPRLPAAA